MKRILLTLVLGVLATSALTQSAGPLDSKATSTRQMGSIELAGEIDSTAGRQLRARLVTIEPGGHAAVHTHQGRPTMEYVLQGTVIEVRNGIPIEHKAGDMVRGVNGVTHWWENKGSEPVVLLPVDVFKP
jgi:quercetin dioxygenase-like cupin family protein